MNSDRNKEESKIETEFSRPLPRTIMMETTEDFSESDAIIVKEWLKTHFSVKGFIADVSPSSLYHIAEAPKDYAQTKLYQLNSKKFNTFKFYLQ